MTGIFRRKRDGAGGGAAEAGFEGYSCKSRNTKYYQPPTEARKSEERFSAELYRGSTSLLPL